MTRALAIVATVAGIGLAIVLAIGWKALSGKYPKK